MGDVKGDAGGPIGAAQADPPAPNRDLRAALVHVGFGTSFLAAGLFREAR